MALIRSAALVAALLVIPVAAAEAKPQTVNVMSRNLYLGADLTPGVRATNLQELVNAAGAIYNEVDANRFDVRAKGLASEILANRPHLVGLQEAALWRTAPCDQFPIPPKATTVRYDYIKMLLANLGGQYTVAVTKPEFDFEVWANTDGNEQTAGPNCPNGSEINGRLTMRDAILVRKGVKVRNKKSGTFDTLLQVTPSGVKVDVTRGWTSLDATVKGKKFRFVNTHLEAFDSGSANTTNRGTSLGNGQIREAQAKDLVKRGGPARSKLPVIMLGDFNSDVKTEVKPGDGLAYRVVAKAKFVERNLRKPLSCCLNSSLLTAAGGGRTSDFDHKIDHIFTNAPKRIKLRKGAVTGIKTVNGFWSSDHAGVYSSLIFD